MTILFYRAEAEPVSGATPLPPDLRLRSWRPSEGGAPPPGRGRVRNFVWLAFDRLGLFSRHSFEEISIWRGERMLQRLIITPRWYRFPFMVEGDLQIGDVWTDPAVRGRGLARAALAEAHRRLAVLGERPWYLVDADNAASVRLIESCGYRLVGEGRRTRPLGLRALGRFRLETVTVETRCEPSR